MKSSVSEWTSLTFFSKHFRCLDGDIQKLFDKKPSMIHPSSNQGGLMDLQPDIPEAKRVPKAQSCFLERKTHTTSPKVSNKTNDYVRLRLFETFFLLNKKVDPKFGVCQLDVNWDRYP